MPFPGSVRLLIEFIEGTALPETMGIVDEKLPVVDIQGHRIRGIGLQLHRLCPGLGRGLHDSQGPLQGVVMIAGHLGDDEGGIIRRDSAIANFDQMHLFSSESEYIIVDSLQLTVYS